jgi:anti-anti-sigma regulatory factor
MSTMQADDVVVLPANCNIAQVEQLYELFSSAAGAGRVKIDASQVATADTAGLQLLLAVQKRLGGHGGSIEWIGLSDVLKKAAMDLGLPDLVKI